MAYKEKVADALALYKNSEETMSPEVAIEQARLHTLKSYKILDTPSEADFDRLTKLAASVCETPIAIVFWSPLVFENNLKGETYEVEIGVISHQDRRGSFEMASMKYLILGTRLQSDPP